MGEKSDAKLMYSIDGKEFRELGEIPEVTISHDIPNGDIDDFGLHSSTMSASLTIKLSKKQSRRLMEALFPREFTNNWLRRHGLPMRRKVK
jgi:cell division inhibitor SulA